MKYLNIGCDKAILDSKSDVRQRIIEYAPLMEEFHIHTVTQTVIQGSETKIQIAPNEWVYPALSWFRSIFLCAEIIRENKIDVIISPDPFGRAWVSMLLAFVFSKKFLLSVYGGNIFDLYWKRLSIFNRIYSWIGRIVFWYADAIQTDGLETLDVLTKRYGKKVFWKPMVPANSNELVAIDRTVPTQSLKPKILYVGRLIRQKNIPLLVKVIKEVNGSGELGKNAEFVVVGDGPEKHLLKDVNIKHYLQQSRSEIVERFKEADMLVITSHFEGFARVMMEAALAGIPVVTTKVSGVSGLIIDDVSGFVLEQGNEKGFIEAVMMLIENVNKRVIMGQKAREIAKVNLSVAMMTEKQKVVYDYLEYLK